MNRSKNICIVRHAYFPEDPRVYKEVSALCESGYSVDIVCLGKTGEKRRESINGVNVYRMPLSHKRKSPAYYFVEYGLSFLMMFFTISILFFKRRYKCVQVNTMPDALVFLTIIPKIFGSKILLDMHEPIPELFITKFGENRMRFLLKIIVLVEQLAIRYSNKVLTVNDILKKRFIERGADGRKIEVVMNVPDENISADTENGKTQNGFTLITHGTIDVRYGHEVIIKAVAKVRSRIRGLKLYIVGDGENLNNIKALAEKTGCNDIIEFTGYIPFSTIGKYIQKADAGIVPILNSPFADLCQPNKMFEYIAYKKPVIISRLKAIEEIFDDSCVLYFEPGDFEDLAECVMRYYNNREMSKELIKNSYSRYNKFRWNVSKSIYLNAIKELIL